MLIFFGLLVALATPCASRPPNYTSKEEWARAKRGIAPHIVGGSNANETIQKYQVALRVQTAQKILLCGGTWLDDGKPYRILIVTAAHCIRYSDIEHITAFFGMMDRYVPQSYPRYTVSTHEKHANYSIGTISHDIAVLIIDKSWTDIQNEVELAGGTRPGPIKLANAYYYDNELAVTSGWGTLSSGGDISRYLQQVSVPIWSHHRCQYESNMHHSEIDQTMLCCGEAGKDSCQGDSGGPLVVWRYGEFRLVGAVSWGYGCALEGYPGVYADTYYFRNWILSH